MVMTPRERQRAKSVFAKSKKMKHKLINNYKNAEPGSLLRYLEQMKRTVKRVESEMIDEINDKAVKIFLLEYYSTDTVNNAVMNNSQPHEADDNDEEVSAVLDSTNNEAGDVCVVDDDVHVSNVEVIDAMDLQQQDAVEEDEVEQEEDPAKEDKVVLTFYESGED